MAIGSTLSVGLIGLKAFIVQVQAFISPGLPYLSIRLAANPCDREHEPCGHAQTRFVA